MLDSSTRFRHRELASLRSLPAPSAFCPLSSPAPRKEKLGFPDDLSQKTSEDRVPWYLGQKVTIPVDWLSYSNGEKNCWHVPSDEMSKIFTTVSTLLGVSDVSIILR